MADDRQNSTTTPPRSRKGAATRARILATARHMLVSAGYDGVVMRTVAAEAQMVFTLVEAG